MDLLIEVFNSIIVLEPDNETYYFDKANAFLIAGNQAEAIKIYEVMEKKFGQSPQLLQARQRVVFEGKNAPGNAEVEALIKSDPNDITNYLYLSKMLVQKNNAIEAIALLLKAKEKLQSRYELNLALADIYRAQKNKGLLFTELKEAFNDPAMPVEKKVKIVWGMLGSFNDPDIKRTATELAALIVASHPGDAKALSLYGDVFYRQGSLREAQRQYSAALKLSDQIYPAWEQLMNILITLGDYKEAVKRGDEALSIYPNQAILYYYQAFAQHRDGANDAAISNIRFALQLDADNKQLQAMILALQGEIFIDQNKLSAADDALAKAVILDPENYMIINNYAYYLAIRNQDLNKAATMIAKAAVAVPEDRSVAHTYSVILFKQAKYDQAKSWIEKALQNNSEPDPVYIEHLGDVLYQQGNKEQALIAWERSRSAGNTSEKLMKKINEKKYFK
ncbi:MAG: tetratricopeptide repeat protein [Pedobacter sp.]|nr:MAG: tetratricopeptide repeat protein [Pedobacter sp.]